VTSIRTRYAHLTGTQRDTARQHAARPYGQGASIQSVAREIGGSYGLARTLLLEADVVLRGRGGGARKAGA
jgi:hypothetical protein